jgi:hypothetical protein
LGLGRGAHPRHHLRPQRRVAGKRVGSQV